MSADFWSGYVSGAIGIVVGNPLDLIKVRMQARNESTATGSTFKNLTTGTAAPILGYGALNALLFLSYNRSEAALNQALGVQSSLLTTWLSGAIGGLTTWVVSTPTEVVKCRAQVSNDALSSSAIARRIWREEGIRGFYFGGLVTVLRDSIGYGFYFWSYELATNMWPSLEGGNSTLKSEAPKVLICGGLAGVATWASVFPLDVIKTQVQTQAWEPTSESRPLIGSIAERQRAGAWEVAKEGWRQQGTRFFFRGFSVCCARAFVVNAVQWAVYEWMMAELGQRRNK